MSTLNIDELTVVGMIDPAGSKNQQLKKQRSSQAIIVVGGDGLRAFVLKAWHGRISTDKLVKEIFDTYREFPTMKRFGCETNGLQELFSDTVEMLMKHEGLNIPLEGVQQSTKIEKKMRIRMLLQPWVAWGRLFIPKHMVELLHAITAFPQTELSLIDLVDCLASAVDLLPSVPLQRDREMTLRGLASFLHKSGVPPHVAAGRIEQFRREQQSNRRHARR